MQSIIKSKYFFLIFAGIAVQASLIATGAILWASNYNSVIVSEDKSLVSDGNLYQDSNDIDEDDSESSESAGTTAETGTITFSVDPYVSVKANEKRSNLNAIVVDAGVEYPVRVYSALALPDDPLADQWWVSNARLSESWDIGYGSSPTLLAIIDTGYALGHEELSDRWFVNSGENGPTSNENPSILNCTDRGLPISMSCNLIDEDLDGILDNESGPWDSENPSILNCTDRGIPLDKSCNMIDDDGNGYVDDISGWDFSNSYPVPQAGKTNPDGASTTHGTLVAGIAAANGNNAKGIAGVNWQTKILPLQAIDDDGYGDSVTVSRSIRYAADQGADVISLSLGTASADTYTRLAVEYAISKGSIVIAASGNQGCQCILYPARYEEVIAVGASDSTGMPTAFSNYGSMLDILAPGIDMTSSTWNKSNQTSAYATGIAGTSFSTPLVAGLLTQMRSHQPTATAAQLTASLMENVNRTNIAPTVVSTPTLGFGRVDAAQAVGRASTQSSPVLSYAFSPVSGGTSIGSYEPFGQFAVTQCAENKIGTTSVFRLTKDQQVVYTISVVERNKSISAGYTSALVGNSFCMNLPTDLPSSIRVLSIPRELEVRNVVKY